MVFLVLVEGFVGSCSCNGLAHLDVGHVHLDSIHLLISITARADPVCLSVPSDVLADHPEDLTHLQLLSHWSMLKVHNYIIKHKENYTIYVSQDMCPLTNIPPTLTGWSQ